MKIVHVVGARPNFMKAAPVIGALAKKPNLSQLLVHTGQHYDANMSEVFFQQLRIPAPDVNLEVGNGTVTIQTAQIMIRLEEYLSKIRPDLVVVYGDVTSTVAAALVCVRMNIRLAHIEAGLRSFDRTMPEEINRILTDQMADLLFTPSVDGNENLSREGIPNDKVHLVGNVMIDTLVQLLPRAIELPLGTPKHYVLITLHRPSNVDNADQLSHLWRVLNEISHSIPIVFPVHPRTRKKLDEGHLVDNASNILLMQPLGYLEFLALQRNAMAVVTDSGGVQEETTYLGVPCLTVRENTERPITIQIGTNILVGQDLDCLKKNLQEIINGRRKTGVIPPLWDGRASERIADRLVQGF